MSACQALRLCYYDVTKTKNVAVREKFENSQDSNMPDYLCINISEREKARRIACVSTTAMCRFEHFQQCMQWTWVHLHITNISHMTFESFHHCKFKQHLDVKTRVNFHARRRPTFRLCKIIFSKNHLVNLNLSARLVMLSENIFHTYCSHMLLALKAET